MSKPIIKVLSTADYLRIKIDGLLHLSISLTELVGIQSWKYGDYRFAIEYTCRTTKIETLYTCREIWEAILKQLEQLSII